MNIRFFFALILLCSYPAFAQPKLTVVGGDKLDWGRIAPGKLKKVMRLANDGNDTLYIAAVMPTCGCTTAPLKRNMLVPHDTVSIDVTLDMTGHVGDQERKIVIRSNDPVRHEIQVILHAHLLQDVVPTPDYFTPVYDAQIGKESLTSIDLHNVSDVPLIINPPVDFKNDSLKIRFETTKSVTLQPGEKLTLVAFITPYVDGIVSKRVKVTTSGKINPEFELLLYAMTAIKQDSATQ